MAEKFIEVIKVIRPIGSQDDIITYVITAVFYNRWWRFSLNTQTRKLEMSDGADIPWEIISHIIYHSVIDWPSSFHVLSLLCWGSLKVTHPLVWGTLTINRFHGMKLMSLSIYVLYKLYLQLFSRSILHI